MTSLEHQRKLSSLLSECKRENSVGLRPDNIWQYRKIMTYFIESSKAYEISHWKTVECPSPRF